MSRIIMYLILALALFSLSYAIFLRYNRGLARNSRGQQFRRYLVASLLASLPSTISLESSWAMAVIAVTAVLWMVTYNILYDKTHRKSSPDYDNHMDIAFGIYLFGWLSCLGAIMAGCGVAGTVVMTIVEVLLLVLPLVQIMYYLIYKVCVDANGMQVVQETNYNEVIEYIKSFKSYKVVMITMATLLAVAMMTIANIQISGNNLLTPHSTHEWAALAVVVALLIFFSIYIWKISHGLFVRTGIVILYNDILEYRKSNKAYKEGRAQRLKSLAVSQPEAPVPHPHTIVMVIGESACRDYMDLYRKQDFPTTPWQSDMNAGDDRFILFSQAYSCAMQTVPSLERALTECNQYNDKDFVTACSIVDIAHKAGYRVHWYSNQGHLGCADTPVTLVAETSDVAKWTKQELNKVQYDQSLLEFMYELNPEVNNLLVLHLKGNHFNYSNRYPEYYAQANGLASGDDVVTYKNSIHYNDHILKSIYDYARQKLNMAAMVYFSDHGAIPYMRRSPQFLGFGMVRIPLWVWLSEEYATIHSDVFQALKDNKDKSFTNDLIYELMCGLMCIQSEHYDTTASIASNQYRYTKEMMTTYDGRIKLTDDKEG